MNKHECIDAPHKLKYSFDGFLELLPQNRQLFAW